MEQDLRQAAAEQEREILAEQARRPLVGARESGLSSLSSELGATWGFARKLPQLSRKYSALRRVRGDGNCFFRAFVFRLLEELCGEGPGRAGAQARAQALVAGALPALVAVGYEAVSVETFTDFAQDTFAGLSAMSVGDVEALVCGPESEYLVWFARLVCAGFLKRHAERFLPFLQEHASVDEFCAKEVEPMGKECDQVQIIALTEYFGARVFAEYLDAGGADATLAHEFGAAESGALCTMHLLYRPSHYDVLYP
jgi:ubiquitin thioesterase protein OTUB1